MLDSECIVRGGRIVFKLCFMACCCLLAAGANTVQAAGDFVSLPAINLLLLTNETCGASPKDISCFSTFRHKVVRTTGTISVAVDTFRIGQPHVDYLTSGILVFELPDLKGANITSANLKFRVNSNWAMSASSHVNLNIDALRGTKTKGEVLATDFEGLGIIPPAVSLQEDIVLWDDNFPSDFETSNTADDILASWLVCQFDQIGTGGLIFLRISPDQDPISNCYMDVNSASAELIITTDGNEDPIRGFGDTVSVQMGPHAFSWTFDTDVEWGYFIDGQPWIVEPVGGVSLIAATPTRRNSETVYLYPSTEASPISTIADINITVKNPIMEDQFIGGSYQINPNGVFGWDSRTGNGTSSLARYNSTLGWDGFTSLTLRAGDSITTPKSMTSTTMPDRASVLDALAVLTILDQIPPSDAFRPGPLREGSDRTNPEILRYSDVIDLTPYLIQSPVGVTLGLEGAAVSEIERIFTYPWLQQLLPGPGFINTGSSSSEGVSAYYNNNSYIIGSTASPSYGGYMGTYRFGPLAIGSLADWLTPEERKLCQIRLIQRAIDTYSALQGGLTISEGAGILPGYSTMITIAGTMLNHEGMLDVNDGINGVPPWFIFADYATTFHTDGVNDGDLAAGEVQADRQISLFYNIGEDRPELNKVNITPILSATTNTMTVQDNFYWGNGRPFQDVINLKLRVTAGPGAGDTIYIITESANFNGEYGGTVTIKPAWQAGIPDASSTIALSITTSKPGSLASDDARWLWAVDGVLPWYHPAIIQKIEEISTSPTHNYISIQSGATLGNLIALYALNAQDDYKGALDKFMIDAGTRPGYGELIFGGVYFYAINLQGSFRGALWRQEVLDHPSVSKNFVFTGQGVDSLLIPDVDALMWYE